MGEQRSGLNLFMLKDHNMSLVLAALRAAGGGGISQTSVATASKLSPQAISKIVGRLVSSGLVAVAGQAPSTGGKPATLLRLAPSARQAVGIHLDVHRTTFRFEDLCGSEIGRATVPIGLVDSVEAVLSLIEQQVDKFVGDLPRKNGAAVGTIDLLGVGLACPGSLDPQSGVLLATGHPSQWANVALKDHLTERLCVPVTVMQDVHAAARALLDLGASGQNCLHVNFGEGLGAGLILNGAVFHNQHSYVGEFGHQVVDVNGPLCVCGRRGCIEAVCLLALERGDVEESARVLAVGVANLDLLVGIDRVTLGGPVIEANPDVFRNRVEFALATNSAWIDGRVRSVRGDDGIVAHGAATSVLDTIFG